MEFFLFDWRIAFFAPLVIAMIRLGDEYDTQQTR
jgi:hypothetical protein